MKICDAVNNLNLLSFSYEGYSRLVEPHTYGIDTKGNEALRAYQISGGSESGEYSGWKLFRLDRMNSPTVSAEKFSGPRPGYKRGDKAFPTIYCQL